MLYYYIIDDVFVQPIEADYKEDAISELRLRFGDVDGGVFVTEAIFLRDYADRVYKVLPVIKGLED